MNRVVLLLFLILFTGRLSGQVSEPVRIGQTPGGAGYHVNYDSASHRLFVGCGTGIWAYDMSDTSDFHVIARRPLLGIVNETDLYGNILFVAATHDGVWALDATSDTLTPLAHYEIGGDSAAYDLWRSNDTLYIADGRKVRMLKYDPTGTFIHLATFGPDGSFCVSRRGNHIAVGAQGIPKGTVCVYQHDFLSVPVAMWQSTNAWDLQDIQFADLSDSIIYLCAGPQNLLFTQSYFFALQWDGAFINAIDSFSVPGIIGLAQANINNMDSRNDTLFLSTTAGLNNQFQSVVPVLDASALPGSPMVHLADIRPGLWHFDVALMRGTPYLAMSSEWLGVLISDISQLQPEDTLGFLETGGWCQRAYARGDTLWACMRGYGLVAYEMDSLLFRNGYMNNPVLLHIFTQFVTDVAFIDDSLIALTTSEIYNLKPWFSGGLPAPAGNLSKGAMETIRTVHTNSGTRIVAGLSDILLPMRQIALINPYDSVSGYPILDIDSTNSDVNGLFISHDTLFCGRKHGNFYYLAMYKVSDDQLILIDTVRAPAEISGISKEGQKVVVACGMFWFAWYYIDQDVLVEMGRELDWNLFPRSVAFRNNLAYIADKFFGLRIYRITEAAGAELVAQSRGTGGWVNLFGSTGIDVGEDGRIFLSDFNAGVIIMEPYDSVLSARQDILPVMEADIVVFPNPFSGGSIYLLNQGKTLYDVYVTAWSAQAKPVIQHFFPVMESQGTYRVPETLLVPGAYLLLLSADKGKVTYTGTIILR